MKVKFDWGKANRQVLKRSRKRMKEAAEFMAKNVKSATPIGTVSWPIYKTGPYAGQTWTSRDAGRLRGSVRVVERDEDSSFGFELVSMPNFTDIRIYVGHYLAWYARIVEFYTPFFRPAIESSKSQVKVILENA